jgi:hypothetical protein
VTVEAVRSSETSVNFCPPHQVRKSTHIGTTVARSAPLILIISKNIRLNPLKTFVYKSSSYLTGNTLRLHYKAQPVNAVWGNSRCLL